MLDLMTPSRASRHARVRLCTYYLRTASENGAMHQRLGGAIYAGPEVHGAQLFTAAGLEVAEELSPVGGVTAEHQVHQQRPAGGFSAEYVDFTAEISFGPSAQETGVFVRSKILLGLDTRPCFGQDSIPTCWQRRSK